MLIIVPAALHGQTAKTGNLTPKTMNSLSAIAGHEGDEEDWDIEREIGRYSVHEDEVSTITVSPHSIILFPFFVYLSIFSLPTA
jgi:hypothetical protein